MSLEESVWHLVVGTLAAVKVSTLPAFQFLELRQQLLALAPSLPLAPSFSWKRRWKTSLEILPCAMIDTGICTECQPLAEMRGSDAERD